jgi:hypothetical protein
VFDIVLLSLEISKPYSWRCLYIISCLIVCVIFNLMEAFILLRINWTFVQWESESMYWTMTQIVSRLAVTLKKSRFCPEKTSSSLKWRIGMSFHSRSWLMLPGNKTYPPPSHGNKIVENVSVSLSWLLFIPGFLFSFHILNKGTFSSSLTIPGIFFFYHRNNLPLNLNIMWAKGQLGFF